MKAIVFTRDGFRKDVQLFHTPMCIAAPANNKLNLGVISEEMAKDMKVEIVYFYFERFFINEYDEDVVIYREKP